MHPSKNEALKKCQSFILRIFDPKLMKQSHSLIAILSIFIVIATTSCDYSKNNAWNEYQALRLDSLTEIVKVLPSKLTFTILELEEEVEEIRSDMNIIRFAPSSSIDAQSDQTTRQYQQLLAIYQDAIPIYRKSISIMEESLLEYTQFKRSVKDNTYLNKKDVFKSEYQSVKRRLLKNHKFIMDASFKVSHSHASFLRLNKQMSKIILEKVKEEDLPKN